jgi:hypothetical protein
MLILYLIPFMAVGALVFEGALEGDARERRHLVRQYRAANRNSPRRPGFFRR